MRTTGIFLAAKSSVMPRPIVPAPMTPTNRGILLLRFMLGGYYDAAAQDCVVCI